MKGINWAKKLTSRKFWLAIANFVTMMIVACGGTENQASQVAALIMAGATVIAYVIGEGLADAAGASSPDLIEEGTLLECEKDNENI
jgi:lipopolysaccharide export LptBFGC system permease protein LptF